MPHALCSSMIKYGYANNVDCNQLIKRQNNLKYCCISAVMVACIAVMGFVM